ncbi:hypothetical protein [Bacillus thuringiensis]|uniref:hypothetical protein n=1 Tax=Bacillus thuringiensis TaxID=1428 RepID=UPI000BF9F660|nr:hypothetical protein [Bacillus thuringiensis]PFS93660.1 hypothetical protein COK53_10600 [Bacillus thuringiensis]
MKLGIECKCGMNIAAESEQETENATVLPIIAKKDNGIQGVMVQTTEQEIRVTCTNCNETARFLLEPEKRVEESSILEWSKVSLVSQEGER